MGREEIKYEYMTRFNHRVRDYFVLPDEAIEKLMVAALKRGARVTDEEIKKALKKYDTDPRILY